MKIKELIKKEVRGLYKQAQNDGIEMSFKEFEDALEIFKNNLIKIHDNEIIKRRNNTGNGRNQKDGN